MIRLTVTAEGLEPAIELLGLAAQRFEEPATELLRALGELASSRLQENLNTEGARLGIAWPALHPATVKIRDFYGHGGRRVLERGGDLLHSVGQLGLADNEVVVGSVLPYAAVLDEGGSWSGHGVKSSAMRNVQAFPWARLAEVDLDDLAATAEDFFALGVE